MKKLFSVLFFIVFLVSCKSSDTYDPVEINSNDRPFAIDAMQKIITAFDEEDNEALMGMFSEAAKENYDLEKQIAEAMEYYSGKSIAVCDEVSRFSTGSCGIKDNAYYFKSIRFKLYDWESDVGESYSFDVIYVLVDDEDSSLLGIAKIYFKDPVDNNGYVLAIGDILK